MEIVISKPTYRNKKLDATIHGAKKIKLWFELQRLYET